MSRASLASWGPAAWTFMHTVSFAYPPEATPADRQRAFELMYAMGASLPCRTCRDDWLAFLRAHLATADSPHLSGQLVFSRFLVHGHNVVNAKIGKAQFDYEHVRELYLAPPSRLPLLVGGAVVIGLVALSAQSVARFRRRAYP